MSTPRKRQASRSPENNRSSKRQLNSSPEEGEVDDSAPAPPILSISLPPKPPVKKIPFPFKKKGDPVKNDAEETPIEEKPHNVFAKFEEDVSKKVAMEEPKKARPRPLPPKIDHYEPPLRSLLSRLEPREELYSRNNNHGGRRRSRSRSPSPSTSYHRGADRHRLPPPRSPGVGFSPLSNDKPRDRDSDRDTDRDRERGRDRDHRYDEGRRYRPRSPDDRHYRGDHRRRTDAREWTQRDVPYMPDRRSMNRRDDRAYDYDRRDDRDRWTSPPRSSNFSPPWAPPAPVLPLPPPSPPPTLPPNVIPEPPSLPPPPMPPADAGPRPPSSTPPPAPPPDARLIKDTQLPPVHAQVKVPIKRPDAPPNVHSPTPLNLPPAPPPITKAPPPPPGPERTKSEKPAPPPLPLSQRPEVGEVKDHRKEIEQAKVRMIQKKHYARRPQKAEMLAYGHSFVGCGLQSDYEATTKLGEGTFGYVSWKSHCITSAYDCTM